MMTRLLIAYTVNADLEKTSLDTVAAAGQWRHWPGRRGRVLLRAPPRPARSTAQATLRLCAYCGKTGHIKFNCGCDKGDLAAGTLHDDKRPEMLP